MKKGVIVLMAMLLATAFGSYAIDHNAEIAKFREKLSKTDNANDSIEILYNIFDLSDHKDYPRVFNEIYNTAARAGNTKVQMQILRRFANYFQVDSVLSIVEQKAHSLPASDEQKETVLFVQLRRIAVREHYGSDKEKQENIARIIAAKDDENLNKYDQILRMFSICEYLAMYAQGPLLVEYLQDLNELVENSNFTTPAVKNFFLNESASIYTAIDQHELALATDKKLLQEYDKLEKQYKAQGREFRTYDLNRFYIYRRMLSNYKAISVEEANDIYDKILTIVANNEDAALDFNRSGRSAAYHAMKNGRYAEALMYLKGALKEDNMKRRRRHLLEMTVEAARATGDSLTADRAEAELKALMKELNSEEARQHSNELAIRYEVSSLRAENAELELENKKEQIENSQRAMTFVVVGWALFIILLVVALYYWTRYRRMISGLTHFIKSLESERDRLKERRYYDYDPKALEVPGDYAPLYKKKDTSKTEADRVVDSVINDILFISSIAMEDARRYRQNVKVTKFMEDSISTITATMRRNLNVNVTYPDPDFSIRVDKQCLQMLVDQILNKAVELSPDGGSIGFSCAKDESTGMARFTFKHSGQGLPHGQEERVLENFFEYEKHTEDGESALLLCRLVNFLSSCSLKSSTGRAHVEGGQLILMVPLE